MVVLRVDEGLFLLPGFHFPDMLQDGLARIVEGDEIRDLKGGPSPVGKQNGAGGILLSDPIDGRGMDRAAAVFIPNTVEDHRKVVLQKVYSLLHAGHKLGKKGEIVQVLCGHVGEGALSDDVKPLPVSDAEEITPHTGPARAQGVDVCLFHEAYVHFVHLRGDAAPHIGPDVQGSRAAQFVRPPIEKENTILRCAHPEAQVALLFLKDLFSGFQPQAELVELGRLRGPGEKIEDIHGETDGWVSPPPTSRKGKGLAVEASFLMTPER